MLELDRLQVKGKTKPETIYTDLGRFEEQGRGVPPAGPAQRRREAGRAFGLEAFYQLYVERVRALIEAPPEESWDGVWVAAEK